MSGGLRGRGVNGLSTVTSHDPIKFSQESVMFVITCVGCQNMLQNTS
jgi:hypothetical protein